MSFKNGLIQTSGRFNHVDVARGASHSNEQPLIARHNASQTFLMGQSIFGNVAEIVEKVAYFLLLQNVEQNELLLGGCDEQMLVVQFNIRDGAVIGVDLIVSDIGASDVYGKYFQDFF